MDDSAFYMLKVSEVVVIKKKAVYEKKVTFFVAECMEFIRYGQYQEEIPTAEEAVRYYESIPAERLNAGKGIGIHIQDTEDLDFPQEVQLVFWEKLDMDSLAEWYDLKKNPQIITAAKELKSILPELTVIDTGHLLEIESVKKNGRFSQQNLQRR